MPFTPSKSIMRMIRLVSVIRLVIKPTATFKLSYSYSFDPSAVSMTTLDLKKTYFINL